MQGTELPNHFMDTSEINPTAEKLDSITAHGKVDQSGPEQQTLEFSVAALKINPMRSNESTPIRVEQQQLTLKSSTEKQPQNKIGGIASSTQRGIQGLKFLDKTLAGKGGWHTIEKRFDRYAVNHRLHKENFAYCVGTFSCFFMHVCFFS